MEKVQKREEIRNYIQACVNPIIQPIVKEIVKTRPHDIMKFIQQYSTQKNKEKTPAVHSDSEKEQDEEDKQFLKKLQEKKKKKIGKKISRQGISAEVFGTFNQKAEFKPREIPKTPEVYETIKSLISKSILFQNVNKDDLNIVIMAMEELSPKTGEFIIQEGEKGDTLFIVASGQYDCTKVIGGKQTFLKTYKSGDSFGELALMYNAPRAATIKCKTEGQIYGLDRATFTNIIQQAAIKKRKANLEVLSKVQIFQDIDPYEKEQVCDALLEQCFEADSYICKQGDTGDRFYIVAEGVLIAEKSEEGEPVKKVFEYKAGDYFGEIALVKNTVRQASIKTETYTRVVSIDREAFKRLLGPIEDILSRNMDKYKKYMQAH